jgi:exopolyphosphatase/guanosine-5'-triphosphate,3'-diphosphate pyrophosphatase
MKRERGVSNAGHESMKKISSKKNADVDCLAATYEQEPSHTRHVATLADELFKALKPWHRGGAREREWLACAAHLHDIGWSQTPTGRAHHKFSAKLILGHDWKSLDRGEVAIVAQIARYHRKTLPKPSHDDYQALPEDGRAWVRRLAGILRVADALDRTHRQIVRQVGAHITDQTIEIFIEPSAPCEPEMATALEKGDLLELASGRKLIVRTRAEA